MSAAAALFSCDAATLRRWCASVGIKPIIDPVDRRRRWLQVADLVALAQLHRRYLPADLAGDVVPGAHECQCQELVDLRAELQQLRDDLSNLASPPRSGWCAGCVQLSAEVRELQHLVNTLYRGDIAAGL